MGWLSDVAEHPGLQLLRGDAQLHVLAVAGVLAAFMNWETSTSRPTWAVLLERTGLARRSLARHLAWLRAAGLLGIVEHGTTPALSPGVLTLGPDGQPAAGTGNTATLYLLIAPAGLRLVAVPHPEDAGVEWVDAGPLDAVEAATWPTHDEHGEHGDPEEVGDTPTRLAPAPVLELARRGPVDVSGTPSCSRRELDPHVRAREIRNLHDSQLLDQDHRWPGPRRPATRQERAAAALEARRRVPDLAKLSTAYVAALLREWFLAGWTLDDVLTALSRPPDGPAHRHTTRVHHVPAWTRSRLAHWRTQPTNPASPPGPSPTARAAAARAHEVALRRAHAERAAAVIAGHNLDDDSTSGRGGATSSLGAPGELEDARRAATARGVAGLRSALRTSRSARSARGETSATDEEARR